jgi:hypothetical protein
MFLYSTVSRLWGPPSLPSTGYREIIPRGVRRQVREADHSPPLYCWGQERWSHTSTPLHVYMAQSLTNTKINCCMKILLSCKFYRSCRNPTENTVRYHKIYSVIFLVRTVTMPVKTYISIAGEVLTRFETAFSVNSERTLWISNLTHASNFLPPILRAEG